MCFLLPGLLPESFRILPGREFCVSYFSLPEDLPETFRILPGREFCVSVHFTTCQFGPNDFEKVIVFL